jgi:hypothetical protein
MHWPGESGVGNLLKYMNLQSASPFAEVIGVVGDIHSESLHDSPRPELYAPLDEQSEIDGALRILLKTRSDPVSLAPSAIATMRHAHARCADPAGRIASGCGHIVA